jgi:hypothetical protein
MSLDTFHLNAAENIVSVTRESIIEDHSNEELPFNKSKKKIKLSLCLSI